MGKQCVIFGTTNFTAMMRYHLENSGDMHVAAFCLDKAYISEPTFDGLPVVPWEEVSEKFPPSEYSMLIGLGYKRMNDPRKTKSEEAKKLGYTLTSFIHPTATISDNVMMGEGNIVLENTVISYKSSIGNGNIIWSGCVLSHEIKLGDYNYIAPGVTLGGGAVLTDNCFIGMNSVIRGGTVLEDHTLIGAMSFVNFSTKGYDIYVPPRTYKLENKISTDLM